MYEDSLNGLKSGRAAGAVVVGLATTLPVETIAPLSDVQIYDYKGSNYEIIAEIFAKFAKS